MKFAVPPALVIGIIGKQLFEDVALRETAEILYDNS